MTKFNRAFAALAPQEMEKEGMEKEERETEV
jgi:hypothetical protein